MYGWQASLIKGCMVSENIFYFLILRFLTERNLNDYQFSHQVSRLVENVLGRGVNKERK